MLYRGLQQELRDKIAMPIEIGYIQSLNVTRNDVAGLAQVVTESGNTVYIRQKPGMRVGQKLLLMKNAEGEYDSFF